ncbi:glutamyl-Q tRNA(Asp) synthetase [Gordonia effusa NBRC 100432]|uniref:Glutamyl-Q tRNA(Asp) synthetase n=1 Tax=Gordonia effusa NBRC 100432 TaxID=1077974 RepID=H0R4Z5_9ACTN|nr:tRNA glutamyl-Q(34) synthetase GluQRS [Gordonia effusa]GAB20146.1 glutamyl-Q tRNA(Asp) synthetase [Gordonia effusa NBRC 100432]
MDTSRVRHGLSVPSPAGRFAPSPSGDLHIGNLRTALLAWLFARTTNRRFLLRMEDLDRTAIGSDQRQIDDLHSLGLDWEPPVTYQTTRLPIYDDVVARLTTDDRTFECFCTRREILDAPTAPHAPPGAYPGTCANLTVAQRNERREVRPPAIRLRSDVTEFTISDELHGEYAGAVDDFVIRRNDGTPAYNLAVVVDDAAFGIDQVVRGDDLISSAPRQAYLASLLGHRPPTYVHVPMVLNAKGIRLSKRDGAVTLADLRDAGTPTTKVLAAIWQSLGMARPGDDALSPSDAVSRFDPSRLPRGPWIFDGV